MIRMVLFAAGFLVITIGLLVLQPGSGRGPDAALPEPVTRAEPGIPPLPVQMEDEAAPVDAPLQQTVTAAPIPRPTLNEDLDDQSLRKMTWGTLSSLNQATGRESAPGQPGSLLHTIVRRSLDEAPLANGGQNPAEPSDGLYVVQEGDSLVSIAERVYGDVNMTGPLFAANQSILGRPDDLQAGQTLFLPAR